MIEIVKEGKIAFKPDVNPQDICPYKVHCSSEQLAWSIGWYKAQVDHLSQEIKFLKGSDLIVIALLRAQLKGEIQFTPDTTAEKACAYMGKEYREAYAKGWSKAQANYQFINRIASPCETSKS